MITTMMMMEMEMMMVMETTMTVAQTRQSGLGLPSGHLVIWSSGSAGGQPLIVSINSFAQFCQMSDC